MIRWGDFILDDFLGATLGEFAPTGSPKQFRGDGVHATTVREDAKEAKRTQGCVRFQETGQVHEPARMAGPIGSESLQDGMEAGLRIVSSRFNEVGEG